MNVYHKLEIIDGKEQFVIYADYPFEYEMALDFDSIKKNAKDIIDKIKEYAKTHLSSVKTATALLVLNGVIIGSLSLSQVINSNNSSANLPETQIVAQVGDEGKNIIGKLSQKDDTNVEHKTVLNQTIPTANATLAVQEEEQNIPNTNNANTVSKTTNTPNKSTNKNQNTNNATNQGQIIKVRLNSGTIVNLSLEDYVIGVVASEMPAEFNSEALKAQAVVARTYALRKTASGSVLASTTADQVYKTESELRSMWGGSFNTYYTKVKNAVLSTKGQYLTYNGNYIEALYFSTSNGQTEDPVFVWGNSVPYLKSVSSPWDTASKFFSGSKTISMSTISQKLGVNLTSVSQISINSRTTGKYVRSITIAGKHFTGTQVRTLLGLRSADFSVSQSGSNIVFTTKGWGHGVGMSQYGANGMANSGKSYSQILKHYYTGVTLSSK